MGIGGYPQDARLHHSLHAQMADVKPTRADLEMVMSSNISPCKGDEMVIDLSVDASISESIL